MSLDKAVDDYYTTLAQETTLGFSFENMPTDKIFKEGGQFATILQDIDEKNGKFQNLDSIDVTHIEGATIVRGFGVDSMMAAYRRENSPISVDSFKARIGQLKATKEDLNLSNIEMLTSKIVISIKNDTLNIEKIDSLFKDDLKRKAINLKNKITFYKPVGPIGLSKASDTIIFNSESGVLYDLKATSKSTFLPAQSTLEVDFTNETATVLKRSLGGILISTLLILAVISSLFYLLKIIKHQKQLAEVKNDLISNITHEFKTPIATIGVALESISNFNGIDDKEKTKKYIGMSGEQLSKLNIMVEKLLETATLDSGNLELNKESANIVELLTSLAHRYKIRFTDKAFDTSFKVEQLFANVDLFHFENALNNILDNAVKYGGDIISIDLIPRDNRFEIHISDNGNNLSKANKDKIFEKFYRVSTGNTHDIKGFGIGLYYTKTIVEKHGGHIDIDLSNQLTTFKITLPNG